MNNKNFTIVVALLATGAFSSGVRAQDQAVPSETITPSPQATEQASIVDSVPTGYPSESPAHPIDLQARMLKDANRASRRARIGLIVSAVSVPVGFGLVMAGVVRCVDIFDSSQCTPGQKALQGMGGTLFWGGLVGTLVSGIILGVRNRDRRRLKRDIAQRRAYWDPATGSLRF